MNPKSKSLSLVRLILISALIASMLISSVYAYDNTQYGFSITAPTGWTTSEGVSGTVVIFYGPTMTETGTDVNINIAVTSTTETLSEAISSMKTDYPTSFSDYSLVSESNRNIGGLSSYELVYTFTDSGNTYKQKQVVLIENGQGFIITCTAIPSNYDSYLPTFEQSIQTFRLTTTLSPSPTIPEVPSWIILPILIAGMLLAFVGYKKKIPSK
ncbi:MAG TPA: DcrB-related protein [Candidatus Binatia bacterium]|nr:DcrB-related protein [Candidatus Binatia bacterium]